MAIVHCPTVRIPQSHLVLGKGFGSYVLTLEPFSSTYQGGTAGFPHLGELLLEQNKDGVLRGATRRVLCTVMDQNEIPRLYLSSRQRFEQTSWAFHQFQRCRGVTDVK